MGARPAAVAAQSAYGCRLEWGTDGVGRLAGSAAVVVIVDVFRFTTVVDVAVTAGASVTPQGWPTARPSPSSGRAHSHS